MKADIRKKMIVMLRYAAVVVIIAAVLIPIKLFSDRNTVSYTAPPPAVEIAQPSVQTIESAIVLSGYIEAEAMIPVVPFVSGTILEYPVKAGMSVAEGDTLAVIDEEPLRQQMLQAQAAYTGIQNSYVRVHSLYEAGAATQQDFDTITAQRDAAKAQYDLARLQLGYAAVKAPVSGTVLMAPFAAGSAASQEQPVAVIADLDNLVVRLQVPEKYFPLFSEGGSADDFSVTVVREAVSGISQAAESSAAIESVSPYIDARSKMFEVVCRLQDNIEAFRPGMYIKVRIVYRAHEAVPAIPVTALRIDGSCFVYDIINASARRVSFGERIADSEWCMVPPEYAGQYFIISGHNQIYDGQKVSASEISLEASLNGGM